MKTVNYLLLLALAVGLVGCSSYYATPANSYLRVGYDFSQVDQVAMINVAGAVQSEVIRKQIEDAFTAQILQKGYAPVVSEFLTRQLTQIQFDASNMSPEVFAIEAGRALGYSTVLIINVPNFSDEISITAKLLDVESNTILWIGQNSATRKSASSRGGSWFKSKEAAYASEFETAMMQYNGQAYQTAPGYGGVGQMLTSEEERQVYELIASICDSLPLKPMGVQPYQYQPQIPQYSQPIRNVGPAPVQPTPQAVTPQPVTPQPQVQQPVQTPIQEPMFQPQPAPQPTRPRSTRKFRWRDLID